MCRACKVCKVLGKGGCGVELGEEVRSGLGGKGVTGGGGRLEGSSPSLRGKRQKGGLKLRAGMPGPLRTAPHERGRGGGSPPFPLTGCRGRLRAAYTAPTKGRLPCGGSGAWRRTTKRRQLLANPPCGCLPREGALLAPSFAALNCGPAPQPRDPEFKVEEGAGALRTKSNTAFV